MALMKEFREFAARGNVVDLAVGVIIGAAFGKIVASLVEDIVMPLAGTMLGGLNVSALSVQIGAATLKYGKFIQTGVDFLLVAIVIFFAIKAINRMKREEEKPAVPAAPARQEVLLEEIRDILKAK